MFYQQLLCPICKKQLQVKLEFGESVVPYKHYVCACGYALKTGSYDPSKSIKARVEELMRSE